MNGKPTWRERHVLQRFVSVAAFVVAVAGFLLGCIGTRWVATVAVCTSGGGGGTSSVVEALVFLLPAALFAAGGWNSRSGRTRLASILWGTGIVAAILMFLAAWLLLIGVTLNCANASGSETAYFGAAWSFGVATVLAGVGRALRA